jgi:PelA/Pel-15E family pectate lyase
MPILTLRRSRACALAAAVACGFALVAAAADRNVPLENAAAAALKRACRFAEKHLSIHGGYLGEIAADFSWYKGEGRATKTQNWIQPPGTPTFGFTYLEAYEATGDRYYLDLARKVAGALDYGQLASGGWNYIVDHDPKGKTRWYYRHDREAGVPPGRRRNTSTFDDNTTQAALRFLIAFHRVSGEDRFRKPVDYGLAFMLRSQFPNGAWPQRYPLASKGYSRFYTYNDNAINDCIRVMLDAYRAYGKEEYRTSVLKAGDFILLSQGAPPQAGWAQQYDHDLKPAPARKFEPAAWCPAVTVRNLNTLVDLYVFSGNAKYLEPFDTAAAWLATCRLPDGRWPRFVEIGTNKPLYYTRDYKLTYDDADMPTHYAFQGAWSPDSALRRRDRILAHGLDAYRKRQEAKPAKGEWRSRARRAAPAAQRAMAQLDEQGRWVTRDTLSSAVFNRNARSISAYLRAMKQLGNSAPRQDAQKDAERAGNAGRVR